MMVAINGGRGAAFAAGPDSIVSDRRRSAKESNREPLDAIKVLLAAGANPNAKAPDGATPLHQAVTARQVAIIRALVAAGAKLDAVNKDNLTPLLLAEKPEPPPPPGNNNDSHVEPQARFARGRDRRAARADGAGPNDPAPVPPPLPREDEKKDEKKTDDDAGNEEKSGTAVKKVVRARRSCGSAPRCRAQTAAIAARSAPQPSSRRAPHRQPRRPGSCSRAQQRPAPPVAVGA